MAGAAPVASRSATTRYDSAGLDERSPLDQHAQGNTLQRELVRYATLAPSSHNTQCWKFALEPHGISIRPDYTRRCPAVDPDDHHLFVSLGCATENLVHAARAMGFTTEVQVDGVGDGGVHIALTPARPQASALFRAIPQRQCSRDTYSGRLVDAADLRTLEQSGQGDGVRAVILTGNTNIERLIGYVVRANTTQMHDRAFITELQSWIRFNAEEAIEKGDGLSSLCTGNAQVPRWLGTLAMRIVYTPKGENDRYTTALRSSAGIALFVSDIADRAHWVEAGRSYERFVLTATTLGMRTAMVNQPVEVVSLRHEFADAFGFGGQRPDLVVRFGYGPAMPSSLRRSVSSVLA